MESVDPQGPTGPADTPPSSAPDFNVLLIEDNPVDALYFIENLRLAFNVYSADTLANGIEKLGQVTVHCIILDLCLPDAHGLEVIRKVREAFLKIPIVVVTSYVFDEDEVISAGAQDYIKKTELWPARLLKIVKLAIVRDQAEKKYRPLASHVEELRKDFNETVKAINGGKPPPLTAPGTPPS